MLDNGNSCGNAPVVPELCIIIAGSSSISLKDLVRGYGVVELSKISARDGNWMVSSWGPRAAISSAFCFFSSVYTNFEQTVALRR